MSEPEAQPWSEEMKLRIYETAREIFIAEGGHLAPSQCINSALLFEAEWDAFGIEEIPDSDEPS